MLSFGIVLLQPLVTFYPFFLSGQAKVLLYLSSSSVLMMSLPVSLLLINTKIVFNMDDGDG